MQTLNHSLKAQSSMIKSGNFHKIQLSYKRSLKLLFSIWLSGNAAVRSGDYYLFEDLDEKVELDLLHERPSAGIDDAITDRKLADKLTVEQVNVHVSNDTVCFLFATIHQTNQIRPLKFHQKRKLFVCFFFFNSRTKKKKKTINLKSLS